MGAPRRPGVGGWWLSLGRRVDGLPGRWGYRVPAPQQQQVQPAAGEAPARAPAGAAEREAAGVPGTAVGAMGGMRLAAALGGLAAAARGGAAPGRAAAAPRCWTVLAPGAPVPPGCRTAAAPAGRAAGWPATPALAALPATV